MWKIIGFMGGFFLMYALDNWFTTKQLIEYICFFCITITIMLTYVINKIDKINVYIKNCFGQKQK